MRYFLAIPADWFHVRFAPVLRACWQSRSFACAFDLCREQSANAESFTQRGNDVARPLCLEVIDGLSFRRELWRGLAGELMLFGAVELPELETPVESWALLAHQTLVDQRGRYSVLQQAVHGARDLCFGAYYRPDHAGWNDRDDVVRIGAELETIDPNIWKSDDLTDLPEFDRTDELDFARQWFLHLRAMYRRAVEHDWIIVCEQM